MSNEKREEPHFREEPQFDPSAMTYDMSAQPDPNRPMPDDIDVQGEALRAEEQNVQGQASLTAGNHGFMSGVKLFFSLGFVAALMSFCVWWFLIRTPEVEVVEEQKASAYNTSRQQINKTSYENATAEDPLPAADEGAERLKRPIIAEPPKPVKVEVVKPQQEKPAQPVKEGPSLADLQRAAPMMGNTIRSDVGNKIANTGIPLAGTNASAADEADTGLLGEKFNQMLTGTRTQASKVSRVKNRHLTVEKGTFIDCILETRLDTTVSGMTACVIPQNIYSMDGRTVLIEKGSRALGEYRGSVQNGLERIFLLWTEVRTPTGMVVKLDSPAADALGGGGVGGYVDHHWWKRFGNALLFSIISDGFDFATAKAQEGRDNNYYTNTSDNMSAIIEQAMQQAGNIPPTLTKNQGERVGIFVARDIDFSSVYSLDADED